jgi:hypothetical protein
MLLVGTATAFNAGVILHKIRNDRALDALVDVCVTSTMSAIYAGTLGGTAIAMVASFLFSIYLWFFPVELPEVDLTPLKIWSIRLSIVFGLILVVYASNFYSFAIMSLLI